MKTEGKSPEPASPPCSSLLPSPMSPDMSSSEFLDKPFLCRSSTPFSLLIELFQTSCVLQTQTLLLRPLGRAFSCTLGAQNLKGNTEVTEPHALSVQPGTQEHISQFPREESFTYPPAEDPGSTHERLVRRGSPVSEAQKGESLGVLLLHTASASSAGVSSSI